MRVAIALTFPSLQEAAVGSSFFRGQIESRLANESKESENDKFVFEPSAPLQNDFVDPCLSSRRDLSRISALRDGCWCMFRTSIVVAKA